MSDPFNFYVPYSEENVQEENTRDVSTTSLIIAFSGLALYGTTLPWVTVRGFDDQSSTYNLTDVRGGIGILVSVVIWVLVGLFVSLPRRRTGLTVMSLGVSVLGWLAGITAVLLGTIASLVPSIAVAGVDLARASVSQGHGVTVTVVSSLAAAFLVIRQYPPLQEFSTQSRIAVLPLLASLSVVAIASSIHEPWMILGVPSGEYRAYIAGDSLFGSGLVVIAVWISLGLWITALIVPRTVVMRTAGVASILIAGTLIMYTSFVWLGGNTLSWLVPSNVEQWSAISAEPALMVALIASTCLGLTGAMSFMARVIRVEVHFSSQKRFSNSRVRATDVVGLLIGVSILGSVIYRAMR
jgi:hypothetical protein